MLKPSRDRYMHPDGYWYVRIAPGVRRREHILVAGRALGKPLPRGAHVHHVNHVRDDNRPENLVVCQDAAYHMLLEVRQRALVATGDPNKRKCVYCGEWDAPHNLVHLTRSARNRRSYHQACNRAAKREQQRRLRVST